MWRITKLYKEERERPVYIVVDYSASMQFGTQVAFKSVIAAEAASLIAWAAAKHGDRIGAIVFNGKSQIEVAPAPRERGVMQSLKLLIDGQTLPDALNHGLSKALTTLRRRARPGSVIFIFSDFNGLDEEAKNALAHLAPHNEIVANFIYDPLEAELPAPARYGYSDGGAAITNINTQPQILRERFQAQFKARLEFIRKTLHQRNIPLLQLATPDSVAQVLQRRLGQKNSMQWK